MFVALVDRIVCHQPFGLALALVCVAAAVALAWRFRRRSFAFVALALVLAFLSLMSADVRVVKDSRMAPIVVAVDLSASYLPHLQQDWPMIRPSLEATLSESGRSIELVGFTDGVVLLKEYSATSAVVLPESIAPLSGANSTDLMSLAAYLESKRPNYVYLLTDGADHALARLNLAQASRMTLLQPSSFLRDPARIEYVSAPQRHVAGALKVELGISGSVGGDCLLQAIVGDSMVERSLELEAHNVTPTTITLPQELLPDAGVAQIDIRVDAPQADLLPENNRRRIRVMVGDSRPILLVTQSSGRSVFDMMLAQRFEQVEVRRPSQVSGMGAELARYSLIALSDASVDAFPDLGVSLKRATELWGVPLLVAGAENAWGPGGYQGTPLEAIAPLGSDPRPERRHEVVVLLDASESMAGLEESQGQVSRWSLVVDALAQYLRGSDDNDDVLIQPFSAGLIGQPDFRTYDAAELFELMNTLRGVVPSGSTNLEQALVDLNARLETSEEAESDRRILILSDGLSEGDSEIANRVFQAFQSRGAKTTILITAPAAPGWLEQAAAGSDAVSLYVAEDYREFREMLLRSEREDKRRELLREGPDPARNLRSGESFVVKRWVETAPKNTAVTVIARTSEIPAYPLIAHWRFGNGQVIGVAADLASPGSSLAEQGPFAQALAELIEQVVQVFSSESINVEIAASGRTHALRAEARAANGEPFPASATAQLTLTSSTGSQRTLSLSRTSAFTWESPVLPDGRWEIAQVGIQSEIGSPRLQTRRVLSLGVSSEYLPAFDAWEIFAEEVVAAGNNVAAADSLELPAPDGLRDDEEQQRLTVLFAIFVLLSIAAVIWLRKRPA